MSWLGPNSVRALRWLGIALVGLALLVGGLRLAAGTAPGRWLARQYIADRSIGEHGRLQLSGIEGDLLSRFHIDSLELSDRDGVWLQVRDIDVDWNARSSIGETLLVKSVDIGEVNVLRRPVSNEPDSERNRAPSFPTLDLRDLHIDTLSLAEPVAGLAAEIRVNGALRLSGGNAASGQLDAVRLDQPGDRLRGEFLVSPENVGGNFDIEGAPGGLVARLLRLDKQAVSGGFQASGTGEAGQGSFSLQADTVALADGTLQWSPDSWRLNADINTAPWPMIPEDYQGLIDDAELALTGSRGDDLDLETAQFQAAGAIINLRARAGQPDELSMVLTGPVLATLTNGRARVGSLTWEGTLDRTDGVRMDGRIAATSLTAEPARIGGIDGALSIERHPSEYRVDMDLELRDTEPGIDRLDPLLTGPSSVEGGLVWNSRTRSLTFDNLALTSTEATLQANGTVPISSLSEPATPFTLDAAVEIADLSRVSPVGSGPVRATITTLSASEARFVVNARSVRWSEALRPSLRGLRANGRIRRNGQEWRFPELRIGAEQLRASLSARIGPDGWRSEGDLAYSGSVPLSQIELSGALASTFEARSTDDGLTATVLSTTRTLSVGPVSVSDPRLAIELRQGAGTTRADWLLTGQESAGHGVRLGGTALYDRGNWSVEVIEGQLGEIQLVGQARRTPDQFAAQVSARQQDKLELDIDYVAPPGDLRAGVVDARLQARNLVRGGALLDTAEITLSGQLENMTLQARAVGRMRSRFDLVGRGTLSVGDDGVELRFTPGGKWSVHPWSVPDPIEVRASSDGFFASAGVRLGDGRASLLYDTLGPDPTASLTLVDLPVEMLADIADIPAGEGVLDGEAALSQRNGLWSGNAIIAVSELASPAVADMPRLRLDAQLDVAENTSLELRLTGGGLDAHGEVVRAGPTSNLANLAGPPDAAISGDFTAEGSLVALAALYSEGAVEVESADISAAMSISGTRGDPELDGQLRVSNGELVYPAFASRIVGLTLDGSFTDSGVDVETLSATDGGNGSLSGSGRARLTEAGLRAEANVSFDDFHAARNDDLTVEASGDARLSLDENGLSIGGAANIDELRAQPVMSGTQSVPTIEVREINLPKDRRAISGSRLPILLDYRVMADDNVHISTETFTTEWALNLRVRGSPLDPSIVGRADLLGGWAFVLNRRFRLSDGYVRFDGRPQNARVNIAATHQRPDFTATARARGTITSPQVTLGSEPDLPEDEIIARLLFNRPVSELGALEAAQLAAQLSGQNLLDVVGQLRELAGIDRLSFNTGENGDLQVTGGRRFGDNVYVEVGTSGLSALAEILVEWQLTPSLSLLSVIGADSDASVSVQWSRDY
ncbi:translocation/assembly module TamB domain-containing protein [Maricaulis sp. CAU 1757]